MMDPHAEPLLNLYVDGELPLDRQGDLFAHLAVCRACRLQFNALMAFRLATRLDALPVPPAADEALFQRIDEVRRGRTEAREPAARRRALPALVLASVAVMAVLGALLWSRPDAAGTAEAAASSPSPAVRVEPVFLLYPGVTVEGDWIRP